MRRHVWPILLSIACTAQAEVQRLGTAAEDRRSLMVTVYNNNYGLVREVRELELPRGLLELEFEDVAAEIDATSVAFRSVTAPDGLEILEQNYRYDLLSRETLLNRALGQPLVFTEHEGAMRRREGVLLATHQGLVVRFDDGIEIDPRGTISLTSIPEDLVAQPTLVWLLDSDASGSQRVEISYLTNGMRWRADYVAVLNEDDTGLDLNGWVTLDNHSGATYEDARLKLVAGDVRRAPEPRSARLQLSDQAVMSRAEAFAERSFFEYHLYTMSRPTTLANRETKQVSLLTGEAIATEKRLRLQSGVTVVSQNPQTARRNVGVEVRFANSSDNGLGMPLPAGRIRVYKADTDGSLILVGEDTIGHTPVDEDLDLTLGSAFDVVAERRQTRYQRRGNRSSESSYEIRLRNRKDDAETVFVEETIGGSWTITQASHTYTQLDAATVQFTVSVEPGGETVVTYTVIADW